MNTKNTLLGLALASAVALTTAAVAAPRGDSGHGGREGHRGGEMHMLRKLDLTDAQKASINQTVQAARDQNKPQREALRQQRDAFEAMNPNQTSYQAAATRLAQAEGQATQQRVEAGADLRTRIYAMLTPTQQAQMATLKTQAQSRRQQRQQSRQQQPASDAQ